MLYFMPEIIYHDRKPLLSVDVHPTIKDGTKYRMATSSVEDNIRIWEFVFEHDTNGNPHLGLCFISQLEGHFTAVTQVRFSPNTDVNLLASGDVHGRIFIWKLSDKPCADNRGCPGNEKWLRSKVFYHESDVTALCWSPCGKYLASVSGDATVRVHNGLTGRHKFIIRDIRYYPNGVSYDPHGKYLVIMSTDGKMDLICAEKGTKLRYFGTFELPHIFIGDVEFKKKKYRMFHDDVFTSYTRVSAFSPCGQLVCAPAGRLQTSSGDAYYCSYVYKRAALHQDKPTVILRSPKNPTFLIRFCPILFELVQNSSNYSEVIWLALTQDEVIIYDSQHPQAIGLIKDITYRSLSDATWTKDGRNVVVSDTEEYIHYIHFSPEEFGKETKTILPIPTSPCFKKKHFLKTVVNRYKPKTVTTLKRIKNKGFFRAKYHQQKIAKPYKPVLPSWKKAIISKEELRRKFTSIETHSEQETVNIGDTDEAYFDNMQTGKNDHRRCHNLKTALLNCVLPKKDKNYYSLLPPNPHDKKHPPKKRLNITTLLQ